MYIEWKQTQSRRAYLRVKRVIYGKITLSVLGIATTLAGAAWTAHHAFVTPDFIRSDANGGIFFNTLAVGLIFYVLVLLLIGLGFSGWQVFEQAQEVAQLPYVASTPIDTLPLEEVLVRGTHRQTDAKTMLLRFSSHSTTMPFMQLLKTAVPYPVVAGQAFQENIQPVEGHNPP